MKLKRNNNTEKPIKCKWKCSNVKIVLSDPEIQPHHEIVYLKNADDILYYYYTLEVYKKNKQKRKWEHLFTVLSHDCPEILSLLHFINEIEKDDFEGDTWQKNSNDKTNVLGKSYTTSSFVIEDQYSIQRTVVLSKEDKNVIYERYNMFIGSGIPSEDAAEGVMINDLSKDDIISLKEFIEQFIKKSISLCNKQTSEFLESKHGRFQCCEKKLYEYKDKNDHDVLESVYVNGDKVDITIIENADSVEKMKYCEFDNYTLCKVEDEAIFIGKKNVEGEIIDSTITRIPMEQLIYVFNNLGDSEKLTYGEEQCFADFRKILSHNELDEFLEEKTSFLIKKWMNVVINRTWMNREEHGFKNVDRIAKNIIKGVINDV